MLTQACLAPAQATGTTPTVVTFNRHSSTVTVVARRVPAVMGVPVRSPVAMGASSPLTSAVTPVVSPVAVGLAAASAATEPEPTLLQGVNRLLICVV